MRPSGKDGPTSLDAGLVDRARDDVPRAFVDGASLDTRRVDTSSRDTVQVDSASPDGQRLDAAVRDAARLDAWTPDTWQPDTWQPDTWTPDTWTPDTWTPDTWTPDTWRPDTWQPDAAPTVCRRSCGGALCSGIISDGCGGQLDCSCAPQQVMPNLADPDVYKEHDELFFMSGTSSARGFQIYRSRDLVSFALMSTYDPSSVDAQHDYCYLWAPDISKINDTYYIAFSAHRVAPGAACPPGSGQEVTTFWAEAADLNLSFGPPQIFDNPTGQPRTSTASGCPADGCDKIIRIDSALTHIDGRPWLSYVWFENGNNVSSFPLDDPGHLVRNLRPVYAYEQNINEGPDIFLRAGRLYLFFSGGGCCQNNAAYAMYYLMARSPEDLTRGRHVYRYSKERRDADNNVFENDGHSSVVTRGDETYIFYHKGVLSNGVLTARHTYRRRLFFKPDGRLMSYNMVNLRWSELPGYSYSLDLVLRDGRRVGPCIAANILGSAHKTRFEGLCPSHGYQAYEKSQIAKLSLYYSNNGSWTQHVDVAYDGVSDEVFIDLPAGVHKRVALSWNETVTGSEYSLDLLPKGTSTWIGPCVGAAIIGNTLQYEYAGTCASAAGRSVPLSQIARFRICAAQNGNWAQARCAQSAPYDGTAGFVSMVLPD